MNALFFGPIILFIKHTITKRSKAGSRNLDGQILQTTPIAKAGHQGKQLLALPTFSNPHGFMTLSQKEIRLRCMYKVGIIKINYLFKKSSSRSSSGNAHAYQ